MLCHVVKEYVFISFSTLLLGSSGTQDSYTISHGLHDQEPWWGVP